MAIKDHNMRNTDTGPYHITKARKCQKTATSTSFKVFVVDARGGGGSCRLLLLLLVFGERVSE